LPSQEEAVLWKLFFLAKQWMTAVIQEEKGRMPQPLNFPVWECAHVYYLHRFHGLWFGAEPMSFRLMENHTPGERDKVAQGQVGEEDTHHESPLARMSHPPPASQPARAFS
jgi:hypothetical protein